MRLRPQNRLRYEEKMQGYCAHVRRAKYKQEKEVNHFHRRQSV
jgi:hypothetical protein